MKNFIKVFLILFSLAIMVNFASADEVTDAIANVKSLYESGKYSEAMTELNYVMNLIQNKQVERFKTIFPEPLSGWEAGEFISESAGMALLGGGISVNRNYTKEEITVEISLISDSPLLSTFMMMFTNPMFLGSNKIITIKGEKAIEVIDEGTGKTTEIQFVIENRVMLSVKGYDVSRENLIAYAEKIDLAKLKSYLSN